MIETQRIACFVCLPSETDPETVAAYFAQAEKVARVCTEWRRLYFLHRDDVQILDPHVDVLWDPDPTDHPNYAGAAISEYRAEHPDIDWTHYHLLGGQRIGNSMHPGYGRAGQSVVFDPFADLNLHSHEVNGHGLNIGHDGRILSNGAVQDYGGIGVGSLRGTDLPTNNPYRFNRLIPSENIAAGSAVLSPIENHPDEAGPHHQLIELIDGEGNKHYIAYRQSVGLSRVGSPTALICATRYLRAPQTGSTKNIALPNLSVGTERLIGDHVVRFHQIDDGRAVVLVRHRDELTGDWVFETAPFYRATDLPLASAHTGLWWNPKLAGQGFDVIVRGGRCVVGWYTYAERSGQPRWYTMQGDVIDGAAELEVYRSDGYQPHSIGKGHISAVSDHELLIQWVTEQHGRMSLKLNRLHPAGFPQVEQGISGAWHDPGLAQQGLRVHCFGHRLLAYYYGYGEASPPPPFQPVDPFSAQRWWFYDLTRTEPGRYVGQRYAFDGGAFMHPQAPKRGAPTEASITLDGGRLVLDDAKGQQQLQRLF